MTSPDSPDSPDSMSSSSSCSSRVADSSNTQPTSIEGSGSLAVMWQNVETNWDDPRAHAAFLEMASTENNLAFAAARYRAVHQSDSFRRELSEQQLQKLTALAFAQIDASHSPRPEPKKTIIFVAFVVSVVLLGTCLYAFAL